jgi:hypothetical protein
VAPPTTYDPPHVQLGRLMLLARRRGLSFEAWWAEAVRPGLPIVMVNHPSPPPGCVRWPTDRNDRVTWMFAINGSKDGWRRAFNREAPSGPEAALALLAPALGVLSELGEVRELDELRGPHAGIGAHGAVPSAA